MELSQEFANAVGNQTGTADNQTKLIIDDLDKQKQQAKIYNYKQNTEELKKYAGLIFQFTCFYCLFVASIILFCGLGKPHLSDLILTTLLGSTTANVFAFFLVVTKYLFKENKST